MILNEVLTEFLATFLVVLTILKTNGKIIPVTIAFVILTFIAFKISGGFLNPATTILAFLMKRKTGLECFLYVLVQLLAVYLGFKYYQNFDIPIIEI